MSGLPAISHSLGSERHSLIGGDFELQRLCLAAKSRLSGLTKGLRGSWTASGRGALSVILRQLKSNGIGHVHLPAYICESVLQPIKEHQFAYSFYPVDTNLNGHPDPPKHSAVIAIHYFGWLNAAAESLRAETGKALFLIEDASQALLSDWHVPRTSDCAVILSPRKFGPTVLGGWCSLPVELEPSSPSLDSVAWQSLAGRLLRSQYLAESNDEIDYDVENFYLRGFEAVEEYLANHATDVAAPDFVLQLISGTDWREIGERRRANWKSLNGFLGGAVDSVYGLLPQGTTPLGFIGRFKNRNALRKKLAASRIFCPVHWPLPPEINRRRFPEAVALSESCLTLPIDQRYSELHMKRIADMLKNFRM